TTSNHIIEHNFVTTILRRLRTLEPMIEAMLGTRQETVILKQKLYSAEQLVVQIPDCDASEEVAWLAEQWRLKLARWWKAYATLGEPFRLTAQKIQGIF